MKKKQKLFAIRFFFLDFFVFRVLAKNSKIKKKLKTHARLGKKAQQKKRENDSLSRAHILRTDGAARGSVKREERGARGAERERDRNTTRSY
jgi:hypothetical protein